MIIALIACTKLKRSGSHPASMMYEPSTLFRYAMKYARQHSDSQFILSAKYGVLASDTIIETYEETLRNKTNTQRKLWAAGCLPKLQEIIKHGDSILWLAGEHYRKYLMMEFKGKNIQLEPLKGLGIGSQMGWLKKNT